MTKKCMKVSRPPQTSTKLRSDVHVSRNPARTSTPVSTLRIPAPSRGQCDLLLFSLRMLIISFPRLSEVALAAILCTALIGPAGAQFGPPRPKPTGPWINKSLSSDQRADLIVAQVTLDEKVSLLHGGGWQMLFAGPDAPPSKSLGNAGHIPGIPRLGIPICKWRMPPWASRTVPCSAVIRPLYPLALRKPQAGISIWRAN